MNSDDLGLPSPDELCAEVEEMPRKVSLGLYSQAVLTMRRKGYSYAEIADWFSERLGAKITRSQVSYVLNANPAVQNADAEEEYEEKMQDEVDGMEDAQR